jgi:CRISPR-associated protein Cas1
MTSLYISEQGAVLTRRDEQVIVRKNGQSLAELPLLGVKQIVIFGNATITTQLVSILLSKEIPVTYLSQFGRYRGRLQPGCSRDGSIRHAQHLKAENPDSSLKLARHFVAGKIHNMRILVRRQEASPNPHEIEKTLRQLESLFQKAIVAEKLDELRGYEGAATAAYYRVWGNLIAPEVATHLPFSSRNHHPPLDPVNAMLSLGYSLLYQDMLTAINIVGLDPYCGFLHEMKHGHAALASDLIEEWRALIVDSMVLSLLNQKEITKGDFRQSKSSIHLTKEGFNTFLNKYERRMNQSVQHPRLIKSSGESQGTAPIRQCLELQVRELVDCLLDRSENYPAFQIR